MFDTGCVTGTTPAITVAPGTALPTTLSGSLTVGDSEQGQTTVPFTITVLPAPDAGNPPADPGNHGFGTALPLTGEQAHLGYITSANGVDVYEVLTPEDKPLPYGTEVLATLRNLSADYDLAVVQDLGSDVDADAAAPVQTVAFDGSSFASSPHWGTPHWGTPHWGTPHWGTPHWGTPYLDMPHWGTPHWGTPHWGTPYEDSTYLGSPHWGTPHWGTPHWGTPFVDAPHWGTPHWGTPIVRSPFDYLYYEHSSAGTDNSLDGFPLSDMSYTNLSDEQASGSDISFEELGFNNEQLTGKRIAGFSAASGTTPESVLATTDFVGGHTYVVVKGANGACSTTQPYTLQVETSQPLDIPKLANEGTSVSPLVPSGGSTPTPEYTQAPSAPAPQTLFVTGQRIDALYGDPKSSDPEDKLPLGECRAPRAEAACRVRSSTARSLGAGQHLRPVGPGTLGHRVGKRRDRADTQLHHELPARSRLDQVRGDRRRRPSDPAAPRARPDRARQRAGVRRRLSAFSRQPAAGEHVRLTAADRRLLRRPAADRLQRHLALHSGPGGLTPC